VGGEAWVFLLDIGSFLSQHDAGVGEIQKELPSDYSHASTASHDRIDSMVSCSLLGDRLAVAHGVLPRVAVVNDERPRHLM
jgi:hypothetical protein